MNNNLQSFEIRVCLRLSNLNKSECEQQLISIASDVNGSIRLCKARQQQNLLRKLQTAKQDEIIFQQRAQLEQQQQEIRRLRSRLSQSEGCSNLETLAPTVSDYQFDDSGYGDKSGDEGKFILAEATIYLALIQNSKQCHRTMRKSKKKTRKAWSVG